MFSIKINNFRCWKKFEYSFRLGEIVLLKGESGSGKTTLIQAIYWTLFEHSKNVNPNLINDTKCRTNVQIRFDYRDNHYLMIERRKNPREIIVELDGKRYDSETAQKIINSYFSNSEVFSASCYVAQKNHNIFLSIPQNAKMELLNSIAFTDVKPEKYHEENKILINYYQNEIQKSSFNYLKNEFDQRYSKVNLNSILDENEINKLKIQISDLEKSNLKINEQIQSRNRIRDLLEYNQKLFQDLNRKIIDPPQISDRLLSYQERFPEANLEIIDRDYHLITELSNLKMNKLKYKIPENYSPSGLTNDDLKLALRNEEAYRSSRDRFNSISKTLLGNSSVEYSETSRLKLIDQVSDIIDSQQLLKLKSKVVENNSRIQQLSKSFRTLFTVPELIKQEIETPDVSSFDNAVNNETLNKLFNEKGSIESRLQHLEKCKDIIECPDCRTALRYQNGSLIRSSDSKIDQIEIEQYRKLKIENQNQINELQIKIRNNDSRKLEMLNQYQKRVNLENQRVTDQTNNIERIKNQNQNIIIENQKIQNNIDFLTDENQKIDESNSKSSFINSKIYGPDQLRQFSSLLDGLKTISIIEFPKQLSMDIKKLIEQDREYQVANKIEKDLRSFLDQYSNNKIITFDPTSVNDFRKLLADFQKNEQEYQIQKLNHDQQLLALKIKIDEFDQQFRSFPSDLEKIQKSNLETIDNLRKQIDFNQVVKQANELYHNIIQSQNLLNYNTECLRNCQKIEQILIETECQVLQSTVDSINNSISAICDVLFNRDISVTLSLQKEIKSTKIIKPKINFAINYQGGVYDNVVQLSGGEGDRISMAFTIAMNRISSCPLLIFDETLSSLDQENKSNLINVVRENVNALVFIVMHYGVEGIFDSVLDINQYRKRNPNSVF